MSTTERHRDNLAHPNISKLAVENQVQHKTLNHHFRSFYTQIPLTKSLHCARSHEVITHTDPRAHLDQVRRVIVDIGQSEPERYRRAQAIAVVIPGEHREVPHLPAASALITVQSLQRTVASQTTGGRGQTQSGVGAGQESRELA